MTKKSLLIGVTILALAGLAVAVKMFFFPSINDRAFGTTAAALRQAPSNVVVVRPTRFAGTAEKPSTQNRMASTTVKGVRWMSGRNVTLGVLIATAYRENLGRVQLPLLAPKGNYDFLVTSRRDPEAHLRSAISRKLGWTARSEIRDTDIMALKVENSGARMNESTNAKSNVSVRNGRVYFTHMRLNELTEGLQSVLEHPMVDKTGLTNFYDFSFAWTQQMRRDTQNGSLDQDIVMKIIAECGLKIEPDTMAAEMLVVRNDTPPKPVKIDPGQVLLGPSNPGAENGCDNWYHGMSGAGALFIDSTGPADGANDFTIASTSTNQSDYAQWRTDMFPLGKAADGRRPVTFTFSYLLPDTVKDGDNLRIQFRFYDHTTNFIDQKLFWVGTESHDSAMTSYKTLTTTGIVTPTNALVADVTLSANLYDGEHWSSGVGRFDNLTVTTAAH